MRVREVLYLTDCSTGESRPCTSPTVALGRVGLNLTWAKSRADLMVWVQVSQMRGHEKAELSSLFVACCSGVGSQGNARDFTLGV